jgi:hypothetical protein
VTASRRRLPGDTGSLLRAGVIGLVVLGLVGTTLELVFLAHWDSTAQSIVWPGVIAIAVGLGLLLIVPRRATITLVRLLSVAVLAIAALGIWFHVQENLGAGPLDRHFADRWDSMSGPEQLWAASTGSVGPAPVLAPGALAEISLALLLATVAHPALGRRDVPSSDGDQDAPVG